MNTYVILFMIFWAVAFLSLLLTQGSTQRSMTIVVLSIMLILSLLTMNSYEEKLPIKTHETEEVVMNQKIINAFYKLRSDINETNQTLKIKNAFISGLAYEKTALLLSMQTELGMCSGAYESFNTATELISGKLSPQENEHYLGEIKNLLQEKCKKS